MATNPYWESFDVEGLEVRDLLCSCRVVLPNHTTSASLAPAISTATVSATTTTIADDTSITSDCRVALDTTQPHNCLGRVNGRTSVSPVNRMPVKYHHFIIRLLHCYRPFHHLFIA